MGNSAPIKTVSVTFEVPTVMSESDALKKATEALKTAGFTVPEVPVTPEPVNAP